MRFGTLKTARAHYNAYTARIGFSVKAHTSKKKAHTNELEKQQFVCNKFHRLKTGRNSARKADYYGRS
jgi:hypothetical protein